jgi:hypothetical protein
MHKNTNKTDRRKSADFGRFPAFFPPVGPSVGRKSAEIGRFRPISGDFPADQWNRTPL